MHGHSQLFTDPHLGCRGHQQGNGNTKRSLCLITSRYFRLFEAEPLMQTVSLLLFFFFFIVAFQKIHPTPELLEGQQCHQQCEDGRRDGAGDSRRSFHCHSHRRGFQCTDVGGGEPSLRQEQAPPTSKWQGQKGVTCYSSQQGWWSDFVLQGSVDFWFLFILCIFLSCLHFSLMWCRMELKCDSWSCWMSTSSLRGAEGADIGEQNIYSMN